MSDSIVLDQIVAQALKLSTEERIQLIERVESSLEHESEPPQSNNEHWGKSLNALLDSLEPIEMAHPEIDNPVEWVKQIRRDAS